MAERATGDENWESWDESEVSFSLAILFLGPTVLAKLFPLKVLERPGVSN